MERDRTLFPIPGILILAGFLSGCAHVAPEGAPGFAGADPGGPSVQAAPDSGHGPSRRFFSIDGPIVERRAFEIPSGFVRMASSGETSSRRQAVVFAYQPRRISCGDAWKIAKTVGVEAGIDPGVIFGIMRVESRLAVNAMSPAGAVGLMQVMPGPADVLGCGDRLDPIENSRCGVIILSRFLKRYDNNLVLGLSAYNAGFGMPSRARRKNSIPANFVYAEKVLRVRSRFLLYGCTPWD
ncbi:MAG TPA: lytic transglycosylase domain-containing protein [Myxococcota bacterium]|nr:lytic transglycosylase domain-containing protein [Myxococcota bacterium]HOA13732.1 lytic transglycosylase domain-containing protein [Myxococcota bacterium]HOC98339.1 lytic transglycosylase domain-containing protein [Myxococcota bacterium]HOH77361.1 lytic transglycosylase domain-containing protein [Myxococcota bacterium]HPV04942.1 lytic transglycosylase domain-containing protein [Myxococcota bacterium]